MYLVFWRLTLSIRGLSRGLCNACNTPSALTKAGQWIQNSDLRLSINSSGIVRLFGSFQDLVKPLQLHIYKNLKSRRSECALVGLPMEIFLLLLHYGREDWQHQGLILWMKGCSSFVSFDWCDHHRSRVINQPATWLGSARTEFYGKLETICLCPAINRIKLSFFFPSLGFSNQQRHCLEQGGRLLHNLLHTSNTRRVSICYLAT